MIIDPESDKNLDAALAYANVEALSASTIQMLSAFDSEIAAYKKDIYKESKKNQRLLRSITIKDIVASRSSGNRQI